MNKDDWRNSRSQHSRWTTARSLACGVFLLVVAVSCWMMWMAMDGDGIIREIMVEVRESTSANAVFADVSDELIALFPHDRLRQTVAQHSGALEYAPSCFQVEAVWFVPSMDTAAVVLTPLNRSKLFSGWDYSEGSFGSYHDYRFLSRDDRLMILVTYESPRFSDVVGYEIRLTYLTPSQTACRA